ncbi:hypothetical protein GCM10027275_03660 [Rhabdobacter roseus]
MNIGSKVNVAFFYHNEKRKQESKANTGHHRADGRPAESGRKAESVEGGTLVIESVP